MLINFVLQTKKLSKTEFMVVNEIDRIFALIKFEHL